MQGKAFVVVCAVALLCGGASAGRPRPVRDTGNTSAPGEKAYCILIELNPAGCKFCASDSGLPFASECSKTCAAAGC